MNPEQLTASTRKILTEAYEAAVRGDVGGLMAHLHPDAEVLEAPDLAFGGVYRGSDGVTQLLANVAPWMDMSGLKVVRLIADGDYGAAILEIPTLHSGHPMNVVELWQMRDEKLWRCRVFVYDHSPILQPTGYPAT